MKTRSQTTCCIGRRADKSGPRPSVRTQAEIENYVTGKKSTTENLSESKNRENSNLLPLDPPSHKNISKAKRVKWTRDEYKEIMTAFYQALKEPKDSTAKHRGVARNFLETGSKTSEMSATMVGQRRKLWVGKRIKR